MAETQSVGPIFPNLTLALLEVGSSGSTVSAAPTEESPPKPKINLFLTEPCQSALRKFQRTQANLRMAALLSGVASVAATAVGGWMVNYYGGGVGGYHINPGGEWRPFYGPYQPEGITGGAVVIGSGIAAGIASGLLLWRSNQPFESDLCFKKTPRVPRRPDEDWD